MDTHDSLEALGFEEIVYVPPGKATAPATQGQIGAHATAPRAAKQTTQDHRHLCDHRQQQWQDQNSYGDRDQRSVYVCNLNPSTSRDQLQQFFSSCGNIRRITIPLNPETQCPMCHAYIEFSHPSEAQAAVKLSQQQLHGRQINVYPKKTNIRGYDVFQGHMGFSRRGRRSMGSAGPRNTFGRQGAAFPEWSR